jgi:hypothetical protein
MKAYGGSGGIAPPLLTSAIIFRNVQGSIKLYKKLNKDLDELRTL